MIKDFVGGDMGCARLTFCINHCTFSRNRASFFPPSRPGRADVQAKTRDLSIDLSTVALAKAEAELPKLN